MINEVFNSVDKICALLEEAGKIVLERFQNKDFKIFVKNDNSPVTDADIASNKLLTKSLEQLFPGVSIVSEENSYQDNVQASQSNLFWLLDPLDGTKGFIEGNRAFSINLALVKDNVPVLGFLYLPLKKTCYYGYEAQAFKRKKGVIKLIQKLDNDEIKFFIMSKRADMQIVKKIRDILAPDATLENISSAEKFCVLVEGKADVFPCYNDVYEWDVAAGHAMISAVGGKMIAFDGSDLKYGNATDDFRNKHFLAVRSAKMLNANKIKRIVDLCK